jgi:ferredoxin
MAYQIVCEECIECGACETECPEEAISEEEDCYHIDPELCTECGACAEICPQECIVKSQ